LVIDLEPGLPALSTRRLEAPSNPMPLTRLFRAPRQRQAAFRLYGAIVAQARRSVFYAALGVPDTLDGRFELVALHAVLVIRRLNAAHETTRDFTQELFDAFFADMDRALREMGTGDLSVGKQVKRMAQGFYGRARAYEQGLEGTDAALTEALRRNLYGTAEPDARQLATVVAYVRATAAGLEEQTVAALMRGEASFGSAPEEA
jgi:cytochrome b pre-mRNA-processing protein 3